jgi:5'-methylthioadenosine phosphorylase
MIAIIGGSGLEDPNFLQNSEQIVIDTSYGVHSPIKKGEINGVKVLLMSRHGYNHEYSPTDVPYKANIYALKEAGAGIIIAASACGSLRENIQPGTLSFPTQFIDRTTKRDQSYSKSGNVIHESMADPFNIPLQTILINAAEKLNYKYSSKTTVVTIEGPRFSTRAESELFRNWGCDLINMTTVPEVCLAKEQKIPYQVINLVTDYDSWHESKEAVTFEMVIEIMKGNAEKLKELLNEAIVNVEKEFC